MNCTPYGKNIKAKLSHDRTKKDINRKTGVFSEYCMIPISARCQLENKLHEREWRIQHHHKQMLLEQQLHHREQLLWEQEQFRRQSMIKKENQFR